MRRCASSGALDLAEELVEPLGLEHAFDHIQIALNIPRFAHRPGGPHLDGHRPELASPGSFTMLAAIYLGDESEPDSGNLWVWPGSHLVHESLFATRGPRALLGTSGHTGLLEDPPGSGLPQPVLARRGDLLLAHFLLGHNTGGNTSTRTRRVLYYRLQCPGHPGSLGRDLPARVDRVPPVGRALRIEADLGPDRGGARGTGCGQSRSPRLLHFATHRPWRAERAAGAGRDHRADTRIL